MILISTWATYDMVLSLPSITNVLLGLGLFFAIVRGSQNWKGWFLSFGVFVLGGGLGLAGLGLLGINWLTTKISILNPITARFPTLITGLSGNNTGFHPNIVAGTLLWIWPLLLVVSGFSLFRFSWRPSGWKSWQLWGGRSLVWACTVLVTAVLILTQSRAGYIGLCAALFFMVLVVLPPRGRWILMVILLVTISVVVIVVSPAEMSQAREWLIGSGITSEGALSLTTLEGRLELWSRAIYGLQDFPFTGMGMNTFREVVHVLYPLFLVAPDTDIGHPHNEFLHFGLDLGLPGLIALITLYLVAFGMLGSVWRNHNFNSTLPGDGSHPPSALLKALILGLGGGLLAHLVYGLLDGVILSAKPGFIFWVLLGLIAGLYQTEFCGTKPAFTENLVER